MKLRSRASELAVVVLAVIAAGCGVLGLGPAPEGPRARVVAERTKLRFDVPARGWLEATQASPIAVPRVPTGALKVKELVPEGSLVEAGQIVIVFDDTQLSIELDNHRASFHSSERRMDGNELSSLIETGGIEVMRRVAEMERDHAVDFSDLDETIFSRLEILETEVRRDEAEETIVFADASLLLRGEYYDIEERILEVQKQQSSGKIGRVETSLGQLVLKAPIGGLIVYRKNWRGASVAVGDTLWPGNVVMSIVDPESTALTAFVLEKDSAGVAVGAAAEVVVDARAGRTFPGKVTTVAEVTRPIEQGSPVKYAEVQIALDAVEPGLLKPGMKGEARIVTSEIAEAVVLPRSALRGSPTDPWVLVAEPSGGSRRQPVKTGAGDLVRVAVIEGLNGGEQVLLGGESEAEEDESEGEGPTADPEGAAVARAGT